MNDGLTVTVVGILLLTIVCICFIFVTICDGFYYYTSCCGWFIAVSSIIFIYCFLDLWGSLKFIFRYEKNEDRTALEELNVKRNSWSLTFFRLVLVIINYILLPTTSECDRDHKRTSLIALISIASLFQFFECLHIIFRVFIYVIPRNKLTPPGTSK